MVVDSFRSAVARVRALVRPFCGRLSSPHSPSEIREILANKVSASGSAWAMTSTSKTIVGDFGEDGFDLHRMSLFGPLIGMSYFYRGGSKNTRIDCYSYPMNIHMPILIVIMYVIMQYFIINSAIFTFGRGELNSIDMTIIIFIEMVFGAVFGIPLIVWVKKAIKDRIYIMEFLLHELAAHMVDEKLNTISGVAPKTDPASAT